MPPPSPAVFPNPIITVSASSKLRRIKFACGGLALILFLGTGFGVVSLDAQAPAPTQKLPPKVVYVRFWNMLPDPSKDALRLFIGPDQRLMTTNGSNANVAYVPLLPNTYNFSVQRVSEPSIDVKMAPIRLVDANFVTVLATSKNGQIALELLDDTIYPDKDDASGRLVVRQYSPGLRASVSVGGTAPKILNYGEVTTFVGLPATQTPIMIQAVLPNGTNRTISIAADLSKNHHETLLIVSDPYGRLRPVLSVDGHSDLNLSKVMEQ